MHGESGDGGITDEERRTLQAHPWIQIVTIAGNSFSAPNEEPALVAGLVVEALRSSGAGPPAGPDSRQYAEVVSGSPHGRG